MCNANCSRAITSHCLLIISVLTRPRNCGTSGVGQIIAATPPRRSREVDETRLCDRYPSLRFPLGPWHFQLCDYFQFHPLTACYSLMLALEKDEINVPITLSVFRDKHVGTIPFRALIDGSFSKTVYSLEWFSRYECN